MAEKFLIFKNMRMARSICIPISHLKNIKKKAEDIPSIKVSSLEYIKELIEKVGLMDSDAPRVRGILVTAFYLDWYFLIEKLALAEHSLRCICGSWICLRDHKRSRPTEYQMGLKDGFQPIMKGAKRCEGELNEW